jgi:hypothetical protein
LQFAGGSTTHPDEALRGRKTRIAQPNDLRGEEDPALAEFFFEALVLGPERVDDFLVLTVAPTGQDGEQELPGLENDAHG